jgi:flap endonuclease-1
MGIPYIIAPTEAEAQCAVLARAGKVYAAASEDMDTLCFDSPVLLRHLTFSEQRKEPIQEIFLEKVLAGLNMDRKQVRAFAPGPLLPKLMRSSLSTSAFS